MNFKYYKSHYLIIFILVCLVIGDQMSHGIEEWLKDRPTLARINWLTHSFSTLSIIVLAILFVNKIGWKWPFFRWLVDIPNLNGRYEGKIISSYKKDGQQENTEKPCVIEIKQNASFIHVQAYFEDPKTAQDTSKSHSISEEIVKEKSGFYSLHYIFLSESDVLQIELNNHGGTAKLNYYPDKKRLEGSYYNQRNNFGKIIVSFNSSKRLGRFKK
ncbi:MAG: hypothetical protein ABI688_00540 [Bacteroidota bacterium]